MAAERRQITWERSERGRGWKGGGRPLALLKGRETYHELVLDVPVALKCRFERNDELAQRIILRCKLVDGVILRDAATVIGVPSKLPALIDQLANCSHRYDRGHHLDDPRLEEMHECLTRPLIRCESSAARCGGCGAGVRSRVSGASGGAAGRTIGTAQRARDAPPPPFGAAVAAACAAVPAAGGGAQRHGHVT